MFTGIIEGLSKLEAIEKENSNVHFTFSCAFTHELKIDQSVAHNGVCLTVIKINGHQYTVTAIDETLQKTNLGNLKVGDEVNIERCMSANGRFDGHIVQGHVDQTGIVTSIIDNKGSWTYTIEYNNKLGNVTVEKGSITLNGTSLTVVDSKDDAFSVCITSTDELADVAELFVAEPERAALGAVELCLYSASLYNTLGW